MLLAHLTRRLAGVALSLGLVTAAAAAPAAAGVARADSPAVVGGARLAGSGALVAHGLPPLPATTATSFLVADAETGAVLAALNAHQKLAPASTLKTLTALTLIPRLKPSQQVTAQRDAPNVDGTKAGIVAGTTYTVSDLFTAMLMMSANDAAVALADANGGLTPTLAAMNAEAAYLNADDTVARTPDGLDAPGQSSSAYDLALFFRAGLADSQFRHYLALKRAAFPAPGGASFQIQTHDKLLNSYPGMVGGKNGYTVTAQASYVGAATRDGHTIIVAVMRDQPNFWNEVKGLLDWGFAADASQPGASVGVLVAAGAAGRATASATPSTKGMSGGGDHAATGADVEAAPAQRASSAGGVAVGKIAVWAAVAIGGVFFALTLAVALGRVVRRRRRRDRDRRYLAGLSRLSSLRQFSNRP